MRNKPCLYLTVYIFSVADVLEVAARVLPAQLRLWPIGLQPGVVVPPVFGARRHAARGRIPHGERRLLRYSSQNTFLKLSLAFPLLLTLLQERERKRGGNADRQDLVQNYKLAPVSVSVTRPSPSLK